MSHFPAKSLYIKSLMTHIKAYPHRCGYIDICLFMYHAEIPLEVAQQYLLNYVIKHDSST